MQDARRNQGKTGQLIDPAVSESIPRGGEAQKPPTYRGRFAPTPSGPLHLGSLLTGLASFLDARASGGQWLLRIDDLDTPRTQPGAADRILETLEALSLHWDESVSYQSQNHATYAFALDRLHAKGLIYACECTRRNTAVMPLPADGACPGQCRTAALAFRSGEHALRVQVPHQSIAFYDTIKGWTERSLPALCGDFILFRRDKIYAYHLATVVDDHDLGITHIVRGEDLLESTPQQIFLQQALGFESPAYTHTPLMISPDGRKLSKSQGAPPANQDQGGRVIEYLLRHLGLPPPPALIGAAPSELLNWAIPLWNPDALQGASAIVIEQNQIPS